MALAKKPAKKSSARRVPVADSSQPDRDASGDDISAANVIDEQLARYRSMRDFHVTAEPSGDTPKAHDGTKYPFCIQKHAASHLHYDFRLGWNGVLKSWAVAKGPSYVVAEKHLAVQVEDHPMEYGGFEGIIPAGQYGGGTVVLWDQGTWEPQPAYPDVDAGLQTGSLKFILHGTKLQGKWALIRMKPRPKETKPAWLLIKEHDEFERPASVPSITEAEPNSVVTGRTLDQIAASEDHVWNSKETAKPGQAWYRQDTKSQPKKPVILSEAQAVPPNKPVILSEAQSAQPKDLPPAPHPHTSSTPLATKSPAPTPGVPHSSTVSPSMSGKRAANPALTLPTEPQPDFLKPQLAEQAEAPPDASGWLHELKLDGYRIQARKTQQSVQLFTRSGLDWTHRMPELAAEVARLPCSSATLDGEVVVLAPDGNTNFADLQAAFQNDAKNPLTYFVFDLLHLDGRNPRHLPLRERKDLLATLLTSADLNQLCLSEHLETGGPAMFHKACELHAEGIVSKLASAKYTAGRSGTWLKCKCLHEQEFVVGGFTLPSAGHTGMRGIGALLLGYYSDGKLTYAGRTGTGFTQKTHKLLRDKLETLTASTMPFAAVPADAKRGAKWVRPELVSQVRFATWTADHLVRQAAFLGLREDKPAAEVTRETSAPTPKRSSASSSDKSNSDQSTSLSFRPKPRSGAAEKPATPTAVSPTKPHPHPPIRLTHPQKILDTASALTKQALADFYYAIAPYMLPHIADRPLSLVRCPEGAASPCFFQKHVNAMLPKGIGSIDVPDKKTGKLEPYITLTGASATPEMLASLAQLGVLEIHPWGSLNADLEHPDRLIIDLDPDETLPWPTVCEAALDVRARLKQLGLTSFLKTTGGKGLHVVFPIDPTLDWTAAKNFAHAFVLSMEKANPRLYLTKMSKAARSGKIYLDYLRNERGATSVAAFSPRARANSAVSMPLAWSELATPTRPIFRVADFNAWRSRLKKDPWKAITSTQQTADAATLSRKPSSQPQL